MKPLSQLSFLFKITSLPSRERELKPVFVQNLNVYRMSLPSRERELKPPPDNVTEEDVQVAPFTGARVETTATLISKEIVISSLPSRERELKLSSDGVSTKQLSRSLHTRA